jgi:hypothetical protein
MLDLKGKVIDAYYVGEFETEGFTCFWNGKVRWQLRKACSEYEPLNYKRQQYIRGPRGFIIYPGEEKLKISTKEKVEPELKIKKM